MIKILLELMMVLMWCVMMSIVYVLNFFLMVFWIKVFVLILIVVVVLFSIKIFDWWRRVWVKFRSCCCLMLKFLFFLVILVFSFWELWWIVFFKWVFFNDFYKFVLLCLLNGFKLNWIVFENKMGVWGMIFNFFWRLVKFNWRILILLIVIILDLGLIIWKRVLNIEFLLVLVWLIIFIFLNISNEKV